MFQAIHGVYVVLTARLWTIGTEEVSELVKRLEQVDR